MNKKQSQNWWELHLRVALGETLGAEEQQAYLVGRAELEAAEHTEQMHQPYQVAEVRALQARLRALTDHNRALAQQEEALRQQTVQLEQRYLTLTGELLGLEV